MCRVASLFEQPKAKPKRQQKNRKLLYYPVPLKIVVSSPQDIVSFVANGHQRPMFLDATFNMTRSQQRVSVVSVIDACFMVDPVSTFVTNDIQAQTIQVCLEVLFHAAKTVKPDFLPSCFIVDCDIAEWNALENASKTVFGETPVIIACAVHVRRAIANKLRKNFPARVTQGMVDTSAYNKVLKGIMNATRLKIPDLHLSEEELQVVKEAVVRYHFLQAWQGAQEELAKVCTNDALMASFQKYASRQWPDTKLQNLNADLNPGVVTLAHDTNNVSESMMSRYKHKGWLSSVVANRTVHDLVNVLCTKDSLDKNRTRYWKLTGSTSNPKVLTWTKESIRLSKVTALQTTHTHHLTATATPDLVPRLSLAAFVTSVGPVVHSDKVQAALSAPPPVSVACVDVTVVETPVETHLHTQKDAERLSATVTGLMSEEGRQQMWTDLRKDPVYRGLEHAVEVAAEAVKAAEEKAAKASEARRYYEAQYAAAQQRVIHLQGRSSIRTAAKNNTASQQYKQKGVMKTTEMKRTPKRESAKANRFCNSQAVTIGDQVHQSRESELQSAMEAARLALDLARATEQRETIAKRSLELKSGAAVQALEAHGTQVNAAIEYLNAQAACVQLALDTLYEPRVYTVRLVATGRCFCTCKWSKQRPGVPCIHIVKAAADLGVTAEALELHAKTIGSLFESFPIV